ncbi:hypothetical protein BST65_24710 [Bradyrhizobium canariense]|nr:hypothetical protein BST65_24710 [Bradyrhizobium canariense]OSI28128.1 hypothetical protein BST66_30385 [Bradyrhizobium canariense]OSI46123.1 hypothetical protein BSZ20_10910 [Bradyrhizobium canariense]OSI48442.1 hypothetical protein BSZ15_38060 [Bradyrhizobium canariense]OSI53480.1 hypothetical protein BST67_08630 [Bradyrhizobium canariense]
MYWGMPPPPRTGGPPVTNIRNTLSPHWRGWLKPEMVPTRQFRSKCHSHRVRAVATYLRSPTNCSAFLRGADPHHLWRRIQEGICRDVFWPCP